MPTVFIEQKHAFARKSTQYGEVDIPDLQGLLDALPLETRERLRISVTDRLEVRLLDRTENVKATSTDIPDIVEGIETLMRKWRVQRAGEISEAMQLLDKFEKDPGNYMNRELDHSYDLKLEKLEQLCELTGRDSEFYFDIFEAARVKRAKKLLDEFLENPSLCVDGTDFAGKYHPDLLKIYCEIADIDFAPYGKSANAALQRARQLWADQCVADLDAGKKFVGPAKWTVGSIEGLARRWGSQEVLAAIKRFEARLRASIEVWNNWAREYGSDEIKAALRDEYPVGKRVEKEVCAALFPQIDGVEPIEHNVSDEGDRVIPSKYAREVANKLAERVKSLAIVPEGTEISVGRIRSVSFFAVCPCGGDDYDCDEHDKDGEVEVRATAVAVTIRAPHCEFQKWYYAEPLSE